MIWRGDNKIKKGIRLNEKKDDYLTSLRFTNNILLFSSNLEKMRKILWEIKNSVEAKNLIIYTNKMKILTSQEKEKKKEISVVNIKIEILLKEISTRYLEQKITLEKQEIEEIKIRLKIAWTHFNK